MNQSFPKIEKLKSKKQIEQLFSEGKSISIYPLKLVYLKIKLKTEKPIQTGVTVSKRNFKSAVKRNRIKRLLRESYRLNKHLVFNTLEGEYAFMFLYLGREMPIYQELETNMIKVFQKLVKKEKNEKSN